MSNTTRLANSFNKLLIKIAAMSNDIHEITNRASIIFNAMARKKDSPLKSYSKRDVLLVSDNTQSVDKILELALSLAGKSITVKNNKTGKTVLKVPLSDVDRLARNLFDLVTETY